MKSPVKKKPCTTHCPLPEDILLEEIVKRLPTKSVIRFRSVSKTWQSRIMAARHSAGEEEPGTIILGRHPTDKRRARRIFFVGHNQSSLVEMDTSYLWKKKTCSDISIVGCCNGLVCLHLCYRRRPSRLVLWNPATREVNYLPGAAVVGSYVYSLVFDAQTDEHKIVRLEQVWSDDNKRWSLEAEIFSKRGGHWRDLTLPTGITLPSFCRGLTIAGAIYWRGRGRRFKVIWFDTSTEEFREFEGPQDDLNADDPIDLELFKWGDSLGALVFKLEGWEFWLRNKDSSGWTKISTFDTSVSVTRTYYRDQIIFRFSEDIEILQPLVAKLNRELEFEGAFGKVHCLDICDHFHSLVSPN